MRNRKEAPRLYCVAHIKRTLCSLAVWIWCELPLPPLLPETHQVCQRNNWVKRSDMPLQEWQSEWISKGETFFSNPCTAFKTSTASSGFLMFSITSQPLMDCAVCYKTQGDQLEASPKPYVHCIQKPRLTQVVFFMSCFVICVIRTFLSKRPELFSLQDIYRKAPLWVAFYAIMKSFKLFWRHAADLC